MAKYHFTPMENHFEKYYQHVDALQKEIAALRSQINELETGSYRSSTNYYNGAGTGVLSQYYFLTKNVLAQKGLNNILSIKFWFLIVFHIIAFPVKISYFILYKLVKGYQRSILHRYIRSFGHFIYSIFLYLRYQLGIKEKETCKIGIFIPTLNALAGAEKYTINVANALKQNFKNVEIEIISTNIFDDQISLYDVPSRGEILKKFNVDLSGVNFRYLILNYSSSQTIWEENVRKVAQVSKEYDLFVNCQHNLYHSLSRKSLFVCHFPHTPLKKLDNDRLGLINMLVNKLYVRSYNVFITNSPYTNSWLQKYWPAINKNKLEILYPPVLTDQERKDRIPAKQNIILTCGRIDPEKKILELVRTFDKHQDQFKGYQFHIAGSVYLTNEHLKAYYSEIQKIAKKNGNIILHPNISHKKLMDLYAKAKIYWHGMGYKEDLEQHPIRAEHFGITVIEAMTYGCIPVVHASGGPGAIISEIGFDTTWKTEKEIIEKTEHLIESSEGLQQMGLQAIEASKKFSEEYFGQNLISIIKKHNLISKSLHK